MGLISKIFFSRIFFSKASSSVGSPGSAHGSTSIYESEGNLKFQSRSVPPTFYIVMIIILGFILVCKGRQPKFQLNDCKFFIK